MSDHLAARDAFLHMFFAVDRRDWDLVAALLDEEVTSDYTSVWGGEPARQTRAELVGAWRGLLPGFDATHHHLTVITSSGAGSEIAVLANGTATHRLRTDGTDEFWTLGAHYAATLVRRGQDWVITALTCTADWETGDRSLVSQAAARAGSS
jgi:hypothetical protein